MIVDKILNTISKSSNDNFGLYTAYKNKEKLWDDFVQMLNIFESNLSPKNCLNICSKIENSIKLRDNQVFFQCICELMVIYYILRKHNNDFKYEPTYVENGGYNPECSFKLNQTTINIEVKTPNYKNRIIQEQKNSIKLFAAERIPDNKIILDNISKLIDKSQTSYEEVDIIQRMDNKLKDYLEHSQKKFPTGPSFYNILVIALETTYDLDEWYSYIMGDTGVFTINTYVKSDYSHVDAILLTTPIAGINNLEKFKNIDVFKLEETINILIGNPRKSDETDLLYCNEMIDLFGNFTRGFLNYLKDLDKDIPDKISVQEYLIHKHFDLNIVTHYVEYLKSNSNP